MLLKNYLSKEESRECLCANTTSISRAFVRLALTLSYMGAIY